LEVDESRVLVCLEMQIIIFPYICIVLLCCHSSFVSIITVDPHNSPESGYVRDYCPEGNIPHYSNAEALAILLMPGLCHAFHLQSHECSNY
jgi:hypothetical protein